MKKIVFFIEKNVHGAWAVYGAIGVRQYYDYTKSRAEQMYLDECKKTVFYNE